MKGLIGGKPAPPDYMRAVMARAKRLRKAVQPKKGRWQLVLPGFFSKT